MASIELIGLTKHYNQGRYVVKAVDGINVQIESGEFVSIVGRSGSGKTTTLDLLGLLSRPTGGTMVVDGVDTARLSERQRADMRGQRIGFVFQQYNLLASLTVLENVMLPLRYARPGFDGKTRAIKLLEYVGLADLARRLPDQLSGGQQQRVAIARALINNPALVLADEPTGAVDTQTAADLIALMRRLNAEENVTFVIVTHDSDLAAQTDRTIRLQDGRVLSDARVGEDVALAS